MAHTYRLLEAKDTISSFPDWRQGLCSCGQRSAPARPNIAKQHGEDWHLAHMEEVAQLRAKTRGTSPSLAKSRDYYEMKAADEDTPEREREQWAQLARELTLRLNDRDTPQLEELPLSWD